MFFEIDDYNALKAALDKMCAVFERDDVPAGAVFDCKLVAKELLSNALRYGGGEAKLAVEKTGDAIRISVKSETDFEPPRISRCPGTDAECGRGLFLVDAVSESRTYNKSEGICVVVRIVRPHKQ